MTIRRPLLLLLPVLAVAPFVRPAAASAEQEPVALRLQPAFVPELEGPVGVWAGRQKPWREPRVQPRQPRAVRAAFLPAYGSDGDVYAALPGAVDRAPFGGVQEPEPAVAGAGQSEPREAAFPREDRERGLLAAIRAGGDGPSLVDSFRFGLTADLVVVFTEAADGWDEFNRLRLRGARLDVAADVDRNTSLFASLEAGDVTVDGLLLREAGVQVGGFGGGRFLQGLSLRAGRFYADLGTWNTVLPDALPAPDANYVQRTLFGGNLALTGAALHHELPFGWGRFRWSAGIGSQAESDGVEVARPEDPAPQGFGRRNFDTTTSTGRAVLQVDLAEDLSWRFGGSMLYTPEETLFYDDGAGNILRAQRERTVWGFDAGVLYRLPGSQSWHEFAFEIWIDDGEDVAGTSDPRRGEALLYRVVQDEHWSFGVELARVDMPQSVGTDPHASAHQVFVGYAFSPGNRLTLSSGHVNPGPGEQKYFTVGLEWTLEAGATRGAGIPRWTGSAVTAAAGATHPTARRGN